MERPKILNLLNEASYSKFVENVNVRNVKRRK